MSPDSHGGAEQTAASGSAAYGAAGAIAGAVAGRAPQQPKPEGGGPDKGGRPSVEAPGSTEGDDKPNATSATTEATGDAGNSETSGAWSDQTGGYAGLSSDQQTAAQSAHGRMVAGGGNRGQWAERVGLEGYVAHVQGKRAAKAAASAAAAPEAEAD